MSVNSNVIGRSATQITKKNFDLKLDDFESVILSSGSSLQYCHKLLTFLNNYCYILLNYTSVLHCQVINLGISTCALFILLMQSVNGTQFLNINSLSFMSAVMLCYVCPLPKNSYASFRKYLCITVIT